MSDCAIDPANGQEERRDTDYGEDSPPDEGFGPGEEDVARVRGRSRAGDVDGAGKDHLIFGGSKEDGLDGDEKEASGDAGEGKGVREQAGLPVHNDETD